MGRIAIFGGSFNPIHNGHINLCQECDKVLNFDKIILMPTNISPHKSNSQLASNNDRFKMCQIAIQDFEKFEVSDIEFIQSGISYTISTVRTLKQIYKDDEIYLIIGGDMLLMFDKWYEYEEILNLVTLVCGARLEQEKDKLEEYKKERLNNSDKIKIIDVGVIELSSTLIRENFKNNVRTNDLLNENVLEYILKNRVY